MSKSLILVGATTLAAIASAGPVVSHTGSTNPTTEGWTAFGTGGTAAPSATPPAWLITDSSGDGIYVYPFTTANGLSSAACSEGWKLKFTMRLNTGTCSSTHTGSSIVVSVRASCGSYDFWFARSGTNDISVRAVTTHDNASTTPVVIENIGAASNSYVIDFDPVSDTASMSVNGTNYIAGYAGAPAPTWTLPYQYGVAFGDGNGCTGEAEFSSVEYFAAPITVTLSQSKKVCPTSGTATLTATPTPAGTYSYQWWYKNECGTWEALSNGTLQEDTACLSGTAVNVATISGATSATLQVSNVSSNYAMTTDTNERRFKCTATSSVHSEESAETSITLQDTPADVGRAGGDQPGDGIRDNNDFVAYNDLFFNQDPVADMGTVGGVPGTDSQWDNNDYIVFIDHFFSTCAWARVGPMPYLFEHVGCAYLNFYGVGTPVIVTDQPESFPVEGAGELRQREIDALYTFYVRTGDNRVAIRLLDAIYAVE